MIKRGALAWLTPMAYANGFGHPSRVDCNSRDPRGTLGIGAVLRRLKQLHLAANGVTYTATLEVSEVHQ